MYIYDIKRPVPANLHQIKATQVETQSWQRIPFLSLLHKYNGSKQLYTCDGECKSNVRRAKTLDRTKFGREHTTMKNILLKSLVFYDS